MLPVSPARSPAHTSRTTSGADTGRQCGSGAPAGGRWARLAPLEADLAERERAAARAGPGHPPEPGRAVVVERELHVAVERQPLPGGARAGGAELDRGDRGAARGGRAPVVD